MAAAKRITVSISVLLFTGCALAQPRGDRQQDLQYFADNVFHLSEVMLHDVAAPPAASRFYAYATFAAYQVALQSGKSIPDINKKLNSPPDFTPVKPPTNFNLSFCANYAMLETGSQIMPSGPMLEEHKLSLVKKFKKKLSKSDLSANIAYAKGIAAQVVQYARADNYNKLSTFARYSPKKEEGHWYPTPPEYMPPVEPQWKTVRTFFLKSPDQFAPPLPAAFSKDTTSSFYKQMMEVYTTVNNVSVEQKAIADFWDCNPFAVSYSGHMAMGLKKISPGGHWMGIAGITCKKANLPLDSAVMIHAVLALTLHDAFVSCWQEKYSSDRLRPESAINKLVDPGWRPILQTPPFPEYTSGHSVASASAATVLTYLLGDNFAFTDTSEVYFGLPPRDFTSFLQASAEAAISRLYGGIHFRDACEAGAVQGKNVGQFIVKQITTGGGD